jgi:hypothetical protein
MRRGALSIAGAMVVLAFGGVWHGGYAKSPTPPGTTVSSSPAPSAGASLITKMAGASETPPARSMGTGTAKITVDVPRDQVCWNLSVQKLQGTVTGADIHRGPAGKAGPVVLLLSPPSSGSSQGCKKVGPPLARGIVKQPNAYYVNVPTNKFPDGEIRGQL